jgi:hypothetical protein
METINGNYGFLGGGKKNRGMGFSRFPRPQLGDMRHIMPILSAAATKAEDKIQNHMNI